MKSLLILLDGLGDRSFGSLGKKTPLQAARSPYLDSLAKRGSSGLYHAGLFGQAMPSELAHLLIFGFEADDYPGRGPLEALGAGIDLEPGESAFLCHLASIEWKEEKAWLRESRPPMEKHEAKELFAVLATSFGEKDVSLYQTGLHDGVLVLKAPSSPEVTDTDPLVAGQPVARPVPLARASGDSGARESAQCLEKVLVSAMDLLASHHVNRKREEEGLQPLNALLTQRGGSLRETPSFTGRYGLRGASIASSTVYRGIACYAGLDFYQDPDTDSPGEDLARRLDKAGGLLPEYDFIHLHTKAPDAAAHKKDPRLKKKTIEALDRSLAEKLPELIKDPDLLVAVMADHSTPSGGPLIHSGEPVPLLMYGKNVRVDRVRRYNEIDAAPGSLGHLRGKEFMLTILNLMDRSRTLGFKEDPKEPPWWPGSYEIFERK